MRRQGMLASLALSAAAVAHAAPTLLVDSLGHLTGANGVMVDGASYDVTFADGSCDGVFGVCSNPVIPFLPRQVAYDAAQALIDTVLINSSAGQFDTFPNLINGCLNTTLTCGALVPWEYQTTTGRTITYAAYDYTTSIEQNSWIAYQLTLLPTDDTSTSSNLTFAVFAPSAVTSPAPEPSIYALLVIGVGALALRGRARASHFRRHTQKSASC